MREYLLAVGKNPEKTVKHCVYINRIQKRIDRELNMLLWLAINFPEMFLDEDREWRDESGKIKSHRRLKKLLLSLKALKPNIAVELVLENLEFPKEDD